MVHRGTLTLVLLCSVLACAQSKPDHPSLRIRGYGCWPDIVGVGGKQGFYVIRDGKQIRAVTWTLSGACAKGQCGELSATGVYKAPAEVPHIRPGELPLSITVGDSFALHPLFTVTVTATENEPPFEAASVDIKIVPKEEYDPSPTYINCD